MKTVLLYLVVVEIATGKMLYTSVFHRIVLNEKELLNPHPRSRIFGGEYAAEKQFPFMVFVIAQINNNDNEKSCCSGTLIHKDWVLVSAHCLDYKDVRPENIILAGGKAVLTDYLMDRLHSPFHKIILESSYGVQERRAKSFFLHPKRTADFLHDVGLIRLARRFRLKRIKEIKITKRSIDKPIRCMILGWGLDSKNATDGKLKFVKDKLISNTKLGCLYKTSGSFICITPSGGGICQGDSGSPMICNNLVYGVASHLVGSSPSPSCSSSKEEYFSDLYAELNWISSTMASCGKSPMLSMNFNMTLIVLGFYAFYISLF